MRDKPFLARSTFVPWNGIPFLKFLCGGHALFFGTELIKPAYSLGKIRSKGGTKSQFRSHAGTDSVPYPFLEALRQ